MVMSMDASSEQAMSSTFDEAAALGGADSPSTYRQAQQADDDEQNEDDHSKDSSQTVVVGGRQQQQQQRQQQLEQLPAGESVRRSESASGEQAPMVLSRGSSLDEDRRLAMNVDEDESLDDSTSPASSKFGLAGERKAIATAAGRFAAPVARVDSLVAQMRDIVEGGSGGGGSGGGVQQASRSVQKECSSSARQPKSSSDSLNNRDEQNNSKASLESAANGSNKRTRHSRCRHHQHHHHHHQHRHRQSVSGSAMLPAGADPAQAAAEGQSNSSGQQGQQQQHHHHHGRHSSSAHRHHHHHHHHAHHHGHHHAHHQQQHEGKRHSIQRPSLALIDPAGGASSLLEGRRAAKTNLGSQSSVSSISNQLQQEAAASRCREQQANNPNQQSSNPESKSSETPSEEKNFERGLAGQAGPSASGRASLQHGYAHHHHHHHHCHHHRAGLEKRLVLDVSSNQEPELSGQQEGALEEGAEQEAGKRRGPPLQELVACGNDQQTRGAAARHHTHHTHHSHSHPLHHHHHHHHHHNPSAHHGQCSHAKQAADGQQQPNKEGQELQQAASARAHHHRHHRHHRHAHHHAHHCKQHRRSNAKPATGSKTNISELSQQELAGGREPSGQQQQQRRRRDITETNDENKMSAEVSRRMSAVSNKNQEAGGESKSMVVDQEVALKEARGGGVRAEANDEVVEMEMSPSNEARVPAPDDKRLMEQAASSDANLITSIEIIPASSNLAATGATQANQQQQAAQTTSGVAITRGQTAANESNQFQETSYKIEGHLEHKENRPEGGRQNRLVRQMSSQSSKKSQKSDMGAGGSGSGAGPGQQKSQRHAPDCSGQPLQSVINQQPSEPKQVIESSVPTDRRCRLCWCCCCPCSALTNRQGVTRAAGPDDTKAPAEPSSAPTTRFPSLPNVPLDEIRAWGESFDKLMRCKDGRKVFQDFLRCEYSEENILFWSACEELKKERDSKSVAARARDIYEDYISILSSKEVSLDSRVRDVINNNIKKPTSNIFDEAQLQIYTLMHRDSYPRFINSAMYKKLAKIQNNSSRKSSS